MSLSNDSGCVKMIGVFAGIATIIGVIIAFLAWVIPFSPTGSSPLASWSTKQSVNTEIYPQETDTLLPPPTNTPMNTPMPVLPLKELNLVVNGDFRQPWATGWYQYGNPSVVIENPPRNDQMYLRVGETAGDRWVSGACQDVQVAGFKGLRFGVDTILQIARYSDDSILLPWDQQPWSMGAVVLLFDDTNGKEIGQAWWYATRRDDFNPAAEQEGFNHGIVFTKRIEAFYRGQPDQKIREDLAALASTGMPYMDQNAVAKISVCLLASSQKGDSHYFGDGWMTNVMLYYGSGQ